MWNFRQNICRTQVVLTFNGVLFELLMSFSQEKHQDFGMQFWCIWRRRMIKYEELQETNSHISRPGTRTFAAVTCCTLTMPISQQNESPIAAKRDSSISSARQQP